MTAPAGSSRPIWIYVAGPYTAPDPVVNVRRAVELGIALRNEGLVPIIPHLSHLAHLVSPQPYEFWMGWDFALIERCDALVRLPGESSGADREVALARELGLPVFEANPHATPANVALDVRVVVELPWVPVRRNDCDDRPPAIDRERLCSAPVRWEVPR